MKARRFLAYLAIVAVGCGFAVSCDDNDNPKRDPSFYDGQTILHEMSEEDKKLKEEMSGASAMLELELQSDYPFHAEVTPIFGRGIYEIYIPYQAMTINLIRDNYYWLGVHDDLTTIDEAKIMFETEWYGFINEYEKFKFYKKTNEYLTVTHTEPKILTVAISENQSKKTRRISLEVHDEAPIRHCSTIIFIQEGK